MASDGLKFMSTHQPSCDKQLRHHADMHIALSLDDGVKTNCGKFGNLLADVKTVIGREGEG